MELPTEKIIENDDAAEELPSNMDIKYPMLAFEKQIFMDVFETDALVVTYKGLNYNTILSNLLFLYNDPANLILVVNSSDHEEKYFMDKFNLSPLPNLGQEREKAYLEGGIHFVSTRILVVDLLKSRVPVAHVTGIIVLRAHTVLESCQEAFALRLYRQHNKTGFIKAFSNAPISFTFGFHQVEKVMRALFVKELFLWPRFHGTVIKCLKSRQVELVELHVPVSQNTSLIQACLLDIMNYTVKQLKAMNRTLDMQEITTENCITKKFHKILQSQLDCVWHQLSTRTKEYIQDLKVLRTMVINLIHEDSVSFYALVSKYRTAEYAQVNSGWILLDSAEQLFRMARSRVFNSKNEFDPEAPPKWQCLSDLLLSEIPGEVRKKKDNLNNTKILVLCQDNKTCSQLNQYLTVGAGRYLLYTAFRRDVTVNAVACSKLRNTASAQSDKSKNKSRKTNDESGSSVSDLPLGEGEEEIYGEDKSNYLLTLPLSVTQNRYSAKSSKPTASKEDDSRFEPLSQLEDLDITQLETEKPIVCIQSFKENGNVYSLERTLESLRPEYIVLYHSDVCAVRQLELFERRRPPAEPRARVYFLLHDQTVEEQAYLTSLKREKQAFETLIQAKSVMVVPSYQDGRTDEYFTMNNEEDAETPDTRSAGGQAQHKERPLVVVDMREFRSDLPALLHRRGVRIDPVTIAIGDYILSPEICVERKSISDLIGSLNSGRLYSQCTQMCRHYSRPLLLIEFDQNKPFNLQGHFVVSSELSGAGAEVQQKLQLLTIHFPRLQLVWSPSPYATADLFYELKQGRSNPSAAAAAALGAESPAEEQWERYSSHVHDFLRKLPGVTSRNLPRLMNRGGSLDHLVTLTQDELLKIIENKNETEMLYSILHVKAKPADASKEDKPYAKKKFVSKFKNKK